MTMEVGMVPEGQNEERVLGHIAPGEIITLSDYSTGNRQIVSPRCYGDDTGGEVHVFDNDAFPEDKQYRVVPAEHYTLENRVAVIPEGGNYERDIVTETRQRGRLVLRHISPREQK